MRRMLPTVWSSLSIVNDAALIIFVSLSYETLWFLNKKEVRVREREREREGGFFFRERKCVKWNYFLVPSGTTKRSYRSGAFIAAAAGSSSSQEPSLSVCLAVSLSFRCVFLFKKQVLFVFSFTNQRVRANKRRRFFSFLVN